MFEGQVYGTSENHYTERIASHIPNRQTKMILSCIFGAMRPQWCESRGGGASSNTTKKREKLENRLSADTWEDIESISRRERVFSLRNICKYSFLLSSRTRKGLVKHLHSAQDESRVKRIKAFCSVRLTVKRILYLARACVGPVGLQRNATYFAWCVSYD